MSIPYGYKQVEGTGIAVNGAGTATIIAAQGVGKPLRTVKGFLSIYVAATGGGGIVTLSCGTTILTMDANALGAYPFDFGDLGFIGTDNTAITLTVSGAVTTQASARVTLVAYVNN